MKDNISKIDEQISRLTKRKEKLQTQQAVLFLKESEKILGEKFSSDLALSILSHTWKSSSETQKQEWEKVYSIKEGKHGEPSDSFREAPQNSRVKDSRVQDKKTATENP